MITIYSISKWFTLKEENISNKKLQKLCWYAYSWYIALNSNPEDRGSYEYLFIDSSPEAWVHGPVFHALYQDYRHNKNQKTVSAESIEDKDILNFLENVWAVYGDKSGDELEILSHQEKPWLEARLGLSPFEPSNNQINPKDILEEYLPRLGG